MNHTLTVSIGIFIAILLGVSVFWINAEAETAEIDVPFDWKNHGCTLFLDGQVPLYQCYFEGSIDSVIETDETQDETGETVNGTESETGETITETVTEPKTPTEILIERLEKEVEEDKATQADKDLLKILKSLNEKCYFGIEEGLPIQKFSQHLLPEYDPREDILSKNLDLSRHVYLGKILKLLEACEAWTDYKSEYLRQYLDIEHDSFLDSNVTTHAHAADGIEPIPSQKFYESMMGANEERARLSICTSDVYPLHFKKQMNCNIDYSKEPTFDDSTFAEKARHDSMNKAGEICDPKYKFPTDYKRELGCIIEDSTQDRSKNDISESSERLFSEYLEYLKDPKNEKYRKELQQKALEKYLKERK